MVLVRATTMTDWQALREIRLQALLDAPDAFASTHAREAAFGEDEWRQRASARRLVHRVPARGLPGRPGRRVPGGARGRRADRHVRPAAGPGPRRR